MIHPSLSGNKIFLGVDVSKSWIDVADLQGRHKRVLNDEVTIASLFVETWAPEQCERVVCEATGGYERPLMRVAARLKLPLLRVNPTRAHSFAKAFGGHAKTDKIDARKLAAYAATVRVDECTPLPTESQQRLQNLVHRLRQIKAMHHEETCRIKQTDDRFIRSSIETLLATLGEQMKHTQKAIEEAIKMDPVLSRKNDLLRSCKGIGPQSAQAILALLPEIGTIDRKKIAALVGVAPITRKSGSSLDTAHIHGGRKALRDILYMASVTASVSNPVFKQTYARLRANGKPAKLALAAVMRKMIVTLNAMLKTDTFWSPDFCPPCLKDS